ncbi:MAG: site-specific integrase [Bacteroidales bacterium]|nr:site-specific integrase [Bacteroidales bacterium]
MANKVSTSIVLFKKRAKNNGKFPAKLRVTHNRNQRYFSIDRKERMYEFSEKEFEKILAPKPRGDYKDIKLEFSIIEEKARKIIERLPNFDFDDFKSLWGIKGASSNIIPFYDDYIKLLKEKQKEQQWNYHNTKKLLLEFFNKEKYIDFRQITPAKLEQFEKWMLESGRKISTVATYTGTIRTMFKLAIEKHAIPEEIYPFGRGKYVIPQVSNSKRALQTKEIKAIYEYESKPFSEADYARDFWLFSYLGNGMNMVDICRLKYKDIGKETFSFIRHKTKEKNKSCRTVTVPITEDIARIIEKWGNKDKFPDNFVFPFLAEGLTNHQIHQRVRHRVAKLNSGLKTISSDLGFEKKLTSYSARHSFATTLKRNLISTEYISESLGHANLDITKRYLDSFENEQRIEIAKHLTSFD